MRVAARRSAWTPGPVEELLILIMSALETAFGPKMHGGLIVFYDKGLVVTGKPALPGDQS